MSNNAKLKKKAAELESKKHYEKALEVYEQVLNSTRAVDEERDVPLYNRVGDLHYRIGNNEQAISYYEQAADLYAEGGFFNNAIALCNKILRYSPGRTVIYYKLGLISAKKGFNSDAKQNFLEYADRMQRQGKMDEAFRALKEFADLCPGQDDVRLMLAEQLTRADRKQEALEQLELLYDTLQSEGRSGEATATLDRIKAIDPAFKPRRSLTPRAQKKEGLVFLDLDFDTPPLPSSAREDETEPQAAAPQGLELTSLAHEPPAREIHVPEHAPPKRPTPVTRRQTPAAPAEEMAERELVEPSPMARGPEPIYSEGDFEPSAAAPKSAFPFESNAVEETPSSSTELKFIVPADEPPAELPEITPLDLAPLVEAESYDEEREKPHTEAKAPSYDEEKEKSRDDGKTPAYDERAEPSDLGRLEVASIAPESTNGHLAPDDDFIDLGEWLERNRTPASTRMVTHDTEPENDEQKDFGEMLEKFKAGISKNVDEEDFESHYDLGIAFREMGLLDEAIGSFQKALRGRDQRVRASEAIGQCFMDKGEAGVTMSVLQRLVNEEGMTDNMMVGVLYLLGQAAESLGRNAEAAGYFHRVLAVQIGFRDTAKRLSSLTQASK